MAITCRLSSTWGTVKATASFWFYNRTPALKSLLRISLTLTSNGTTKQTLKCISLKQTHWKSSVQCKSCISFEWQAACRHEIWTRPYLICRANWPESTGPLGTASQRGATSRTRWAGWRCSPCHARHPHGYPQSHGHLHSQYGWSQCRGPRFRLPPPLVLSWLGRVSPRAAAAAGGPQWETAPVCSHLPCLQSKCLSSAKPPSSGFATVWVSLTSEYRAVTPLYRSVSPQCVCVCVCVCVCMCVSTSPPPPRFSPPSLVQSVQVR